MYCKVNEFFYDEYVNMQFVESDEEEDYEHVMRMIDKINFGDGIVMNIKVAVMLFLDVKEGKPARLHYDVKEQIKKKYDTIQKFMKQHPMSNWNVENVYDMEKLFKNRSKFNEDISNWNTSNVTNMKEMFMGAKRFHGDLSRWVTSRVMNMKKMFMGATRFNSDISSWDVSRVTNMESMFEGAYLFNQDLRRWEITNVTNMNRMFYNAMSFTNVLDNWDYSNKSRVDMFEKSHAHDKLNEFVENLEIPPSHNVVMNQLDQYLTFGDLTQICEWSGNGFYYFFMLYLFRKYNARCIISGPIQLKFKVDVNNNFTQVGESPIEKIVHCIYKKKVDILVIPITFRTKKTGHSNLLIYKRSLNTFEHFEPNGKIDMMRQQSLIRLQQKLRILVDQVNQAINIIKQEDFSDSEEEDLSEEDEEYRISYVQNMIPIKRRSTIEYIPPNETCPFVDGFQRMASHITNNDTEGYCLAWSFVITELSLCNPTLSVNQILHEFNNDIRLDTPEKKSMYLLQLIRGYVRFIEDIHRKYFGQLSRRCDVNPDKECRSEKFANVERLFQVFAKHVNYDKPLGSIPLSDVKVPLHDQENVTLLSENELLHILQNLDHDLQRPYDEIITIRKYKHF